MLCSTAVMRSWIVNITPASPCIATTGTSGFATFAPIADGRAKPSVPKPDGTNQVLGRYVFQYERIQKTMVVGSLNTMD